MSRWIGMESRGGGARGADGASADEQIKLERSDVEGRREEQLNTRANIRTTILNWLLVLSA